MTVKTVPYRDDADIVASAQAKAKELGVSLASVMRGLMRDWLGLPSDINSVSTLRGGTADVLLHDGTLYNWTGKRKANSMKPVHLVSHGKLWKVESTANGCQKVLRSVTVLPQCLLEKVDDPRADYIPNLLTLSHNSIVDTVATLLEVESSEWFQAMPSRERCYVIDAAIGEGFTTAKLTEIYAPAPVITIPQEPAEESPQETVITEVVVPTPTKIKATHLQQRYGISADEWHQKVGVWKKEGLKTIDGLLWMCNNKGIWTNI